MKWNEWGFRPYLCPYRLKWARRASWEWWDEWEDTALQTQDAKIELWGRARYLSVTEASQNTRSLRVSRKDTFCFLETWMPDWGSSPWFPTFQAGSFNHYTWGPATLRFINVFYKSALYSHPKAGITMTMANDYHWFLSQFSNTFIQFWMHYVLVMWQSFNQILSEIRPYDVTLLWV